jgi:hypothetical protein
MQQRKSTSIEKLEASAKKSSLSCRYGFVCSWTIRYAAEKTVPSTTEEGIKRRSQLAVV